MLLDHSWAEYSVVVRSIITNKPSQQHLSSCQRERDLREKRPWKKNMTYHCIMPYPPALSNRLPKKVTAAGRSFPLTAPLSSIGSLDTLERIPTPAEAGSDPLEWDRFCGRNGKGYLCGDVQRQSRVEAGEMSLFLLGRSHWLCHSTSQSSFGHARQEGISFDLCKENAYIQRCHGLSSAY